MTHNKTVIIEIQKSKGIALRGVLNSNSKSKAIAFLLAGFENPATTEKKFKVLADELNKVNIASIRIDFEGVGLSDGDFKNFCLDSMREDLNIFIDYISNSYNFTNRFLVTHSLASVITPDLYEKFEKFVLISPALNQKELLRFWFTRDKMKKEDPDILVTFENFKNYLDEDLFIQEFSKKDKMTRKNFFPMNYFEQVNNVDFSSEFEKINNKSLVVLGSQDQDVPIDSIRYEIDNRFVVKAGDHNLERPLVLESWVREVVNWLNY